MSTEQNKALVRRGFEIFNSGDLSAADELFAAHYTYIDPSTPGLPPGPTGFKALVTTYRTGFPDLQFTIEDQIAEGDMVVTRWKAVGTQTGPLPGIPPTGKSSTVTGTNIDRVVSGKSVETRSHWDTLGMLQQLGLAPKPG